MLELEPAIMTDSLHLEESHRRSARNLTHYLALRQHDIRETQRRLAALGLSSLGRAEGHVMAALQAVLAVLAKLGVSGAEVHSSGELAVEFGQDREILDQNTEALLGPEPLGRRVRIMVTMGSDAATKYDLVRDLLLRGMDCMRINCAHDDEEVWLGMIHNLQRARQETGRACRVQMDLGGPKLRTGPIEPGPSVLKCRPKRDELGRVLEPAKVWLVPAEHAPPSASQTDFCLPVPGACLAQIRRGDTIRFRDARGSQRTLKIAAADKNHCTATLDQTAYFIPGLELQVKPGATKSKSRAFNMRVGPLPRRAQTLLLKPGDRLMVTRSSAAGAPARYDRRNRVVRAAKIGVTMPEFFEHAREGEPIWFDDGKIGGVIRSVNDKTINVEITQARPEGEKLGAEKGINLPDTRLAVDTLTAADLAALKFVVKHADLVGYSFVRTEEDVRQLQSRLAELGGETLGIVLKIETREAFENLPHLILAAMATKAVGIMIARGDLAVECGYQRLAEVQEEILWISEAAHMPVIWATQVLESLAKRGMPSRSEITDAAMGERAECVMLNKGPYAVKAVQILDDILRRMQAHQDKKTPMLRKLRLASFASAG